MDATASTKLHFAILEHLAREKSHASSTAVADQIDAAIQSLQTAFGLSLNSDDNKTQFSSQPVDLLHAFTYALSNKEDVLTFIKKQSASSVGESDEIADPELRGKFDRYVDLLAKRGYFNGCDKGSAEYTDRLVKAKQRFLTKYHQDKQTEQQAAQAAATAATNASAAAPAADKFAGLTEAQRVEKAEALKAEGNQKLTTRQYADAIALYSDAILLNPKNAIYYSNRAAAYSHLGEHERAITDCNAAIKLDPKYSKAYSRLGLAYFSLGKYREAVEFGYRKALELEPNNVTAKESLTSAEAKIAEMEQQEQAARAATIAGGAGAGGAGAGGLPPNPFGAFNPEMMRQAMNMFGGGAGAAPPGGAPAGMPDMGGIGSLLNNPQFAQMAQNLMSNPAFMNMAQNLASNPDTLRMFGNMFGGGAPGGGNNNDEPDAANL